MKYALISFLLTLLPAVAELNLPFFFTDGMVLQQEKGARIWGWSSPNAEVKATFGGKTASTKCDPQGAWKLQLDGLKASSEGRELIIEAPGHRKVIKDVLVGEVWIASGQSNMEWRMSGADGGNEEDQVANDSLLRVFELNNEAKASPQNNCWGKWRATKPGHTKSFTAVGYFFAKKIRQELNVPVGIIECAWGGKPVQAFVSRDGLAKTPAGLKLVKWQEGVISRYDPKKAEEDYQRRLAKYQADLAAWNKTKKGKKPRGFGKPQHPATNPRHPCTIYNGMIAPLTGYGARGVIWYQGESNANKQTSSDYEELLGSLVADWRTRWGQDLSFYWVQLANFKKPTTAPGANDPWTVVQDEMRRALKTIPNSGMAVINDVGDAKDIHPRNKRAVGERLARLALAKNYGKKDLVFSGPLYAGHEIKEGKVHLNFEFNDGLKSRDGKPLQRFEIAGEDGKWHWATAEIKEGRVILSNKQIKNPMKARYAWAANPLGANLVNGEGLPASCFTTE